MDDGTRISIHYHMSSCNYHILTSHSASRSSGTRIHTLSRHMHALYNAHHITEHDSEVDNVGVSRRMRIMNLVMILTMINIKATPKKTLSELEYNRGRLSFDFSTQHNLLDCDCCSVVC